MLDWIRENSTAVQALATVVGLLITLTLAALTGWYVSLTKHIADSSVEQLRLAKSLEANRHDRTLEALADCALRLRCALRKLDPEAPHHEQLINFTAIGENDLSDLDRLARQAGCARLATTVLLPLRQLLGTRNRVAEIKPKAGWAPKPSEVAEYVEQIHSTIEALTALEATVSQERHAA